MRAAGGVVYDSLKDTYYAFNALLVWNLLWALGMLLVVTAPPAQAALCYAAHQLARQQPVTWRTFLEGFRKYFWLGWRWALLNIIIIVGLAANGQFYSQFEAAWSGWVRGALLGLFGLWLIVQMYVFPLIFEQERPSLRLALRNSLVLWLRRPGFGVGILAFIIFLVVMSTLAPPALVLITASLCAYLSSRSVLFLLDQLNPRAPSATEDSALDPR